MKNTKIKKLSGNLDLLPFEDILSPESKRKIPSAILKIENNLKNRILSA